jgi:hypothetical protein
MTDDINAVVDWGVVMVDDDDDEDGGGGAGGNVCCLDETILKVDSGSDNITSHKIMNNSDNSFR